MSTDCLEPVAILWDIENCGVPQGVNAEDVSVHIRTALKFQLAVRGPVTVFSAYCDFSHLPLRTRQGCQTTGVNLIDIPHGNKDAADKAILVDMFLFALDNPPPCTLVLITGDVDFAPALHKLGQRGYSVVLAVPSGRKVSPALLNACHHLWSWPDIACGKCTHNLLPQLFSQDCHRKETLLSTIETSRKASTRCAGTLGNKPSEAVVTLAGNVGGKGFTSSKSAIKDSKISKTITPNAENVCMNQVKGNDHSKNHCSDGVGDNPNFGKLELGPNGNQIAYAVPKKIPVDMFEECVEVPFYVAKESTEIPVATGMDQNGMGATEIPIVTSCGMAGFAKESVEVSRMMGMDSNGREAFNINRSIFPPSCSTACPVASYGMIDCATVSHGTSQGMDGRITSSNFIPLGGEHVSNQFAIPNRGGLTGALENVSHATSQGVDGRITSSNSIPLGGEHGSNQLAIPNPGCVTGAFEVRKEVFEHSWKGPTHQMEAEYEHMLANAPVQYALPADSRWDNPCSFPCNLTHTNAQVPATRSQNIQQLFANFKCSKAASKQAACAKGEGQDPSLQLKVMKKKKKKAKEMSSVEAASAETPKLTKKQRKAARLAAIQTQSSELNTILLPTSYQ